ncbi:MAG: hypothetical protein ACXVIY_13030, partial [Mucilaginibacter sp.]
MATTTVLSKVNPALRIVLGLIYLVFGFNFFLHFIPATPPDAASKAGHFLGGLFESGYFFVFLKVLEIVFGLLLIINIFT